MQERRRVIRRKMDYYFKIYDANAQRLVGHLSDISARGMLLDSQKPIEGVHAKVVKRQEVNGSDRSARIATYH